MVMSKIINQAPNITIKNKWISSDKKSIQVDVDCVCGDEKDKATIFMDYNFEFKELNLEFFKELHWHPEYRYAKTRWEGFVSFLKEWKDRIYTAYQVLFKGWIKYEGWLILEGKAVDNYIQLMNELKEWCQEDSPDIRQKVKKVEESIKGLHIAPCGTKIMPMIPCYRCRGECKEDMVGWGHRMFCSPKCFDEYREQQNTFKECPQ